MTDPLTLRLEACYAGVPHDVMRAMGLRDFTLPPELRPILPAQAMAGPVFTIDGRVDPAADGHLIRSGVTLRLGHKLARRAIADGEAVIKEAVIKYGAPIGYATCAILPGEHVHLHNVRSGYTASVALELAGSDGPGPYDAGARDG